MADTENHALRYWQKRHVCYWARHICFYFSYKWLSHLFFILWILLFRAYFPPIRCLCLHLGEVKEDKIDVVGLFMLVITGKNLDWPKGILESNLIIFVCMKKFLLLSDYKRKNWTFVMDSKCVFVFLKMGNFCAIMVSSVSVYMK